MSKRYWPLLFALAALIVLAVVYRTYTSRDAGLAALSLPELKRAADAADSDALTHLAYGEKLERANQDQAALHEFERAGRMLDPDQHDTTAERVNARLGYALAYMGDTDASRPYLERARAINRDNWLAAVADATLLIHRRDAKRAAALCRRAVALQPGSYEARYILGLAYNDDEDPGAAEGELQAAAALAPEFAPAQAELGHSFAYRSQYAKAAERFRIARQLTPQNHDYLFALGEALGMGARSQPEYREAAAVQEECLRASPGDAALLFTLGQLHLRFMNLEAAYRCLLRAGELRANHRQTWYNLARVDEMRGDHRAAQLAQTRFDRLSARHDRSILAEKRVAADPKDLRARLELARSFHSEGNLRGCYTQLRAALEVRPGLTEAQIELGRVQTELQTLLDRNAGSAAMEEQDGVPGPPSAGALTSGTDGGSR